MELEDLEDITQNILNRGNQGKLAKMMREETSSPNSGYFKNKRGQYDVSNFAFDAFEPDGGNKRIELTPEEIEYKEENDAMFPEKKIERNPNNPYLTKSEKEKMGNTEDAPETDDNIKLNRTEDGIEITIGDKTGIIKNEEIPSLFDFVKSVMEGDDDEEERQDEDI